MPLKPPTPPRLDDATLRDWIDRRADTLDRKYPDKAPHLRGQHFINMVGNDPDSPKVDKANLMRAFDLKSRVTVYKWLIKLREEMKHAK